METEDIQVSGGHGAGVVVAEAAKALERYGIVRLVGINFAVHRLIQAVEILKHKVAGLHQLNEIEHLEEGNKAKMTITLSFSQLAASHIGYQAPIPESQVTSTPLAEIAKMPERDERRRQYPSSGTDSGPTRRERPPRKPRDERAEVLEEHKGRRPPREEKPRAINYERQSHEEEKMLENEIKVTARRPAIYSVKRAVILLKQQNLPSITLRASGTAISRLVETAEVLRHSVEGLHQVSKMSHREVTEMLRVEGQADVERTRIVPVLEILFSRSAEDTRHYGYQAPLLASKVKEMSLEEALSQ
jgi:DNA-binding protein